MQLKRIRYFIASILMLTVSAITTPASAETWPTDKGCKTIENPSTEIKGWCAAITRSKGNCLACHALMVNPWPEGFPPSGDIGPPLVAMKARFPDKAVLRARIHDERKFVPKTVMLPFGTNGILTEQEIDDIVEFLYGI